MVLSIGTILAWGVGGSLAGVLAGMWDLGSLSELPLENVVENAGELGRDELIKRLARNRTGKPEALVDQWIAAKRMC